MVHRQVFDQTIPSPSGCIEHATPETQGVRASINLERVSATFHRVAEWLHLQRALVGAAASRLHIRTASANTALREEPLVRKSKKKKKQKRT